MTPISQAIRRGVDRVPQQSDAGYFHAKLHTADVLGTAYLGQLAEPAVAPFWEWIAAQTVDRMGRSMMYKLHAVWPDLGRSVRFCTSLAEELERERLIPRLIPHQLVHNQAIHVSLWKVITDMQAAGESRADIAARLGRHGL